MSDKKKKTTDEAEVIAEDMETLSKELDETKDRLLRTAAEYDNFRKRTVKEKEALVAEAKAFAVAKLLPVIDSLERALQMNNEESSAEDLIKGIEMIYKQSLEAFDSVGAETIEGLGEPFDPETQHAVSHIESDEFGENTVSLVMQKGYRIGDKVIRPAMVQVAN